MGCQSIYILAISKLCFPLSSWEEFTKGISPIRNFAAFPYRAYLALYKKNAEQLLKIPGAIGNLFIPGKGLSQKNPAPASHVESRAGALAGSPGQPYPSSEYCGFLELLGSLSIFLLWFLICIQSMCWCRVALARVVVDSFELFMKSHEVGFFWDAVVTLMCCAGSRSSQG